MLFTDSVNSITWSLRFFIYKMDLILTLEIFWGLSEITHIKHLDLRQIHQAHSKEQWNLCWSPTNGCFSKSKTLTGSLGQEEALVDREDTGSRVPRAEKQMFISNTEAFQLLDNWPSASVDTIGASTEEKRRCPRTTFSFQFSWEFKGWRSAATEYVGKELHKPQKSPRAWKHPVVIITSVQGNDPDVSNQD